MIHPQLEKMLRKAVEAGASDLHLEAGSRPALRLMGEIRFMMDVDPLTPEAIDSMLLPLLNPDQHDVFMKAGDLDFSYELPNLARFRCNMLHHLSGRGAVFRVIPTKVPSLAELGLPEVLAEFARWHKGLVLVTGPTGCGKSTTLAAILNEISEKQSRHVITIEDPIEFHYEYKRAFIEQRQLGTHCTSFAEALRAALRESADVLMVGEMRDLETIREALRAAETGHLVLATLHTYSAVQTVNRIVDVFPPEEQHQVRQLLAGTLKAVVCQRLLPRVGFSGRVAAMEIMVVNMAIAGLIRENKIPQIPSFIMMGAAEGMQTLDNHLVVLYNRGLIDANTVHRNCEDREVILRAGIDRRKEPRMGIEDLASIFGVVSEG
jgi:twitching motility protein PilT